MSAATMLLAVLVASVHPASGTTDRAVGPRDEPMRTLEFGAYVDGMVAEPEKLQQFETMVGAPVGIASYYTGYGDVFPDRTTRTFAADGARKVLVSWHMTGTRFREWTRGRHDAYLARIATAARDFPHDLWIRPWPEMNGDWQDFQPTPAGEKPEGGTYRQFIRAWRHVVTYFRDRGVDNLRWVFNPTADTYAETTPVEEIWPGGRYVDVIGLDGFNWGNDDGWGRWLSFEQIFREQYDRLVALAPRKPVWICEFGSKEPLAADGAPIDLVNSKADWMRDAFDTSSMPRIRALLYFQAKKERDWRVESSPLSLLAVRDALGGLLGPGL